MTTITAPLEIPDKEDPEMMMTTETETITPTAANGAQKIVDGDIMSAAQEEGLGDETASASSSGDSWDEEEDDDDDLPMPLLNYSRLTGSIPRVPQETTTSNSATATTGPLKDTCTCSSIAKVLLEATLESSAAATTTPGGGGDAVLPSSDLWKQPHHILAMGFATGHISITNVTTGMALLPLQTVREASGSSITPTTTHLPVVDLSWDASGTFLSAMDSGGTCAIYEFKYAPQKVVVEAQASSVQPSPNATRSSTNPTPATSENNSNSNSNSNGMFSSWMTALTGMPPSANESTNSASRTIADSANTINPSPPPPTTTTTNLIATLVQVSRITYPASFGPPTCIVLDPSYRRKREKSIVVGFQDGRLLLTKRGFFARRSDAVLYQGNNNAIEQLSWRGSLLAWADASGIKLFHVDTLTRIAHVERPTGARPSLYPTMAGLLKPSLVFETSCKLLVGWGDCLMSMAIHEEIVTGPDGTTPLKKRSVNCTMAWELDCVACGVAPLDEHHVLVLGLVSPPMDDDDDDDADPEAPEATIVHNDLQVQIISRKDGAVVHCDSLPLLRRIPTTTTSALPERMSASESAASYHLLSSFALPRMEDVAEAEESRDSNPSGNDPPTAPQDLEFALFSSNDSKKKFVDSHLLWNLKSILFETNKEETTTAAAGTSDDASSVDSDDYGFIVRPLEETDISSIATTSSTSTPPLMVVTSGSDMVLARMATLDDAVAHALSLNKQGLALRRALSHKRQLRRYNISDLVNNYLQALLRLPASDKSLSLRRMKLAIQAMPVLLGGHVELWERWAKELEQVPGALFLLRDHLPVRDPVLPPQLYERMLEKMLLEIEQISLTAKSENTEGLTEEAQRRFLSSLIAWGPTRVLKEYIKLYKFSRDRRKRDPFAIASLKNTEIALQRRYMQTAAGYLNFPIHKPQEESQTTAPRYEANPNDSKDSLYDASFMLELIAPRTPLVALLDDTAFKTHEASSGMAPNNKICLDSMARLRMMQDRYDLALKCFLAIGAFHSPQSLEELETSAVDIVNGVGKPKGGEGPILIGSSSYEFVLGVIEFHHLHQFLLDDKFILSTDSKSFMPLFALLRLVGLDMLGDLLIEHCVSPEVAPPGKSFSTKGDDSDDGVRRETLPIDQVAKQLQASPALLHWYLHLVFKRKPEIYVKFPTTAMPPKAVTDLHRTHFDLYIEFAGDERNSAKSLSGTEAYKLEAKTTPLLLFLKAALPLGGIRPVEARRLLEAQRSTKDAESDDSDDESDKSNDRSHNFSLELAYIIEHYSEQTEAEAKGILDLYLEGANSIMLAVSYAQRQRQYSSILWDKLIAYCLNNTSSKSGNDKDGMLFGSLLEAAALSGADLARLVATIPPGMVVEGLRPRLVAAVADYRLKLDIHEAAATAACADRVSLLREITHRARRGVRYQLQNKLSERKKYLQLKAGKNESKTSEEDEAPRSLPKDLRTVERRDRYSLSFSLPMR